MPPCLGPGCSRLPQGPLAALQKEESGAGGGRADLSVLVSVTGTEKRPNREAHQTGNIAAWPRPFLGEHKGHLTADRNNKGAPVVSSIKVLAVDPEGSLCGHQEHPHGGGLEDMLPV